MASRDHGIGWELAPTFALELERLLSSPAEVIKEMPGRRITRHRVDDAVFYVKRYVYGRSWWRPVKYLLKEPESRREWRVAPELEARGVEVVPHCAYGERWSWRGLMECILITEGRPGGDLRDIAGLNLTVAQQRLGEFVRRLFEAGVYHPDLHVANLLYAPESCRFCLVDVANVVVKTRLTPEEERSQLVKLQMRLPLLPAFYQGYGCQDPDLPAWVAAEAQARFRASLPRYVANSLRPGPGFGPRRYGSLTWQVRLGLLSSDVERLLRDPDGMLEREAILFKKGGSSTVGSFAGLVLKRSNFRKHRNLFVDRFRDSRGRRAFRLARHLELVGISSPRPIATADRRRAGLAWASYFLMEEVAGATPVYRWRGSKPEAIKELADLLARLHEEGFSHRDLKDSNVVFDGEGKPYLLDLDGLRYVGRVRDRQAAANLARLAEALLANQRRLAGSAEAFELTRTDRVRFLKWYCGARRRGNWRWWWREISRRASA